MKRKMHIKKNDTVKVIAGENRGQQGRVLRVISEEGKAIVEGINIVSKHSRPTSENPQGGIIKKEAPVDASNLLVVDAEGNATRIGRKVDEKTGKLVRYSKKSGEIIK
ncbi:MAG: 50S ribosomal protein L24 [Bacteroidales bacterium]|nr:50S ribosomal protein L24 [Bacteroidales bacterium]